MKFNYSYKSNTFLSLVLILFFCAIIYLLVFDTIHSNQKIKLDCNKTDNLCKITKSKSPYIKIFSLSEVKGAKLHCIGCNRSSCRYDVAFYGNGINSRLLGPSQGELTKKNAQYAVDLFEHFLTSDYKELSLFVDNQNTHIHPYVFSIIFFLIVIIFLIKKRQTIQINEDNILYFEVYNWFGVKIIKRNINLADIDELFIEFYGVEKMLICKTKNKKRVCLFSSRKKEIIDFLYEKLNNFIKIE